MAENTQVDAGGTPVPTETADQAPAPEASAVDERGVLYSQSAAEYQRKYTEELEKNKTLANQNQQYQVALGQQQQQVPPVKPDAASGYTAEDTAFVDERSRQIAREEGRRIMVQAEVNSAISENPNLKKFAEVEYAKVLANPAYANMDAADKQLIAVNQAKAQLLQQELTEAKQNVTVPDPVAPPNSAGSSLPQTRQGAPEPTSDNPDADLDHYWEQPESVNEAVRNLRTLGYDAPFNKNDETIVNFHGKRISVKELCRNIAIRACRTGVAVKGVGKVLHTRS